MKKIYSLMTSLLLLMATTSQAVYNKITMYTRTDNPKARLYCFFEDHRDFDGARRSKQQRADLLKWAVKKSAISASTSPDKTRTTPFFIAEDIFAAPCLSPAIAKYLESYKKYLAEKPEQEETEEITDFTTLNGLIEQALKRGLSGCSVEFRSATIALTSETDIEITKKQIYDEYYNAMNAVKAYNPTIPALASYYKKALVQMNAKSHILLTELQNPDTSIETIKELLEQYADCGQALLNAHMLNALHQNRDKETIVICCGGGHIEEIEPVIEQLGYIPLLSEEVDMHQIFKQVSKDKKFKKKSDKMIEKETEKRYFSQAINVAKFLSKSDKLAISAPKKAETKETKSSYPSMSSYTPTPSSYPSFSSTPVLTTTGSGLPSSLSSTPSSSSSSHSSSLISSGLPTGLPTTKPTPQK
jgi:hypothetical protein